MLLLPVFFYQAAFFKKSALKPIFAAIVYPDPDHCANPNKI